ncbi:MAG: response regulator transcription factor [Myxococcota bacterium]|jgi:DNA-binding NarL/FixJ family response regulator
MKKIEVLIVEDNLKYSSSLMKALALSPDILVAGLFHSAEELLGSSSIKSADVALLDIGLPGMDGIELIGILLSQGSAPEILMLTAFEDEERLFRALQAGASGYLAKSTPPLKIAEAIRDVNSGGTAISPALARRFLNHFTSMGCAAAVKDRRGLEADEVDLLTFVAKGLTNAEAGTVMGVGRRTVRTSLDRIYRKLGTRSRVEAVSIAVRAGLVKL